MLQPTSSSSAKCSKDSICSKDCVWTCEAVCKKLGVDYVDSTQCGPSDTRGRQLTGKVRSISRMLFYFNFSHVSLR